MLEKIDINESLAQVKAYLQDLQNRICAFIEAADGKVRFLEDNWQHTEGGGGRSRSLADGEIIEKAGVNFSHVEGFKLPPAATAKRPDLVDRQFQAMGVSVVVHPRNPFAPTSHANVRFMLAEKDGHDPVWWFGGGFDMTPYYGYVEDAQLWHRMAKNACDSGGEDLYPRYKKWCDDYFYLPHRKEPRGIGGLFFDDLNGLGFEKSFEFMRSVGDHYIKAYQPILEKRKLMPFEQKHKDFQLYRRGRYVEFNLLYDRGTLFGLQSGGRTESILMSLPPLVTWKYNWSPEAGSEEARLYEEFLKPKDWV